MKFIYDRFDTRPLTSEEVSIIEKEIESFETTYGPINTMICHEIEDEFIMSYNGDHIFVTRTGPEDEVKEYPNK